LSSRVFGDGNVQGCYYYCVVFIVLPHQARPNEAYIFSGEQAGVTFTR
jgi:hypothetical protein